LLGARYGVNLLKINWTLMPLRSFFEGLGDFLNWTFQLLPFLGNSANYLFMATIAGLGIYWIIQMRKHQKAGEN
jgi:hypothetical protein